MPRKTQKGGRCDVVLLVDDETGAHGRDGFTLDRDGMEEAILKCLQRQYRSVAVVPFDAAVVPTVQRLRQLDPRIVFNVTEWIDGDRTLDAAIAGLLDALKLPYTGTGPDGLHLARDKVLSKRIVADLGVRVPKHFTLEAPERVPDHGLDFPLIVKPRYGDGSEGIVKGSVVSNPRQLNSRVRGLRARARDALLCEEYVEGRDLFVALLGNRPQVLRPLELIVGDKRRSAPDLATYRVKHDKPYQVKWGVRFDRARLGAGVTRRIDEASRQIFHALKLRDYARIDYRLTPENELVFIEANPNPDLSPHTFGRNRCFVGVKYCDLVRRIAEAARRRGRR